MYLSQALCQLLNRRLLATHLPAAYTPSWPHARTHTHTFSTNTHTHTHTHTHTNTFSTVSSSVHWCTRVFFFSLRIIARCRGGFSLLEESKKTERSSRDGASGSHIAVSLSFFTQREEKEKKKAGREGAQDLVLRSLCHCSCGCLSLCAFFRLLTC